jgi:hypothetical protein
MHNICLHRGDLNVSNLLRWSVDFRYFPVSDSEGLDDDQKRTLDAMMNHTWTKEASFPFRAFSESCRQDYYEEWIDRSSPHEVDVDYAPSHR